MDSAKILADAQLATGYNPDATDGSIEDLIAYKEALEVAIYDLAQSAPPDHFEYDHWRHGGWYVYPVRYPSGGCGCVSRQMVNPETQRADRKWRIACDERAADHTYPSRDAAALAEWHLTQADGKPRRD